MENISLYSLRGLTALSLTIVLSACGGGSGSKTVAVTPSSSSSSVKSIAKSSVKKSSVKSSVKASSKSSTVAALSSVAANPAPASSSSVASSIVSSSVVQSSSISSSVETVISSSSSELSSSSAISSSSSSVASSSVDPESWVFRGTANSWGKTPMVRSGQLFVTCQTFVDAKPGFKISNANKADWVEAYPVLPNTQNYLLDKDLNYVVDANFSYDITFNTATKLITTAKRAGACPIVASSSSTSSSNNSSSVSSVSSVSNSNSSSSSVAPIQIILKPTVQTLEGDVVIVLGNKPELSSWNTAAGLPCTKSVAPSEWTCDAFTLPVGTAYEYKYAKRNASGIVTWETGANRTHTAPTVTTTYNEAPTIVLGTASSSVKSSSLSSSSSVKSSSLSSSSSVKSSSLSSSSNSSLSATSSSSSNSSLSVSSSSVSDSSISVSSSSNSSASSVSSSVKSSSSNVSSLSIQGRTAYYLLVDRFEGTKLATSTLPSSVLSADWKQYWGGDIAGLQSKLPYLQSLGIKAVVVSSLVDNTPGGYHGLWGRDFYAVDEHLASNLQAVQDLRDAMEPLGMKLIMEINLNNSSNEAPNPGALWKAGQPVIGVDSFANGAINGWYNDNGSILDAEQFDATKYLTKSLGGRPDFKQGTVANSSADNYLIDAAKLWMDNGVDGFRIHFTKYIEPSFIQRFSTAVHAVKPDAYIFGDWPETAGDVTLANAYIKAPHGAELMDVDLRSHLEAAISDDVTMTELSTFLKARQADLGAIANTQAIYLDNLTDSRTSVVLQSKLKTSRGVVGKGFAVAKAEARQNIGMAMVMTLPGVPVIYYGTEENAATFTVNAAGEVGADPFNREKLDFAPTKKPAFNMIKALADLRSKSSAIQNGLYDERWVDNTANGNGDVLVYQRKSTDGDCALVAINRGATKTTLVGVRRLCLDVGTYSNLIKVPGVTSADLIVNADATGGIANITLEANQVMVFH